MNNFLDWHISEVPAHWLREMIDSGKDQKYQVELDRRVSELRRQDDLALLIPSLPLPLYAPDKKVSRWWHCILCRFTVRDDGSLIAALHMGQHVGEHERQEQAEQSRPHNLELPFQASLREMVGE